MKKIVLGSVAAVILLIGGFFIYNSYSSPSSVEQVVTQSPTQVPTQSSQPSYQQSDRAAKADETLYCNVQKNSCSSYEKTQNSGDLKVTINSASGPAGNLEVDVAYRPGASQYYMRATDDKGVAVFNDLPEGNYKIYFNSSNFLAGYDFRQTIDVKVTADQTAEMVVELKKN